MRTTEYSTLEQAICSLKSDLMNFAPSPTTPYSTSELLKCQAFVVFSHAEMQAYWQAIAKRILEDALNRWISRAEIGRVIGTLIAFRGRGLATIPDDPCNPHNGGDFSKIITDAAKKHTEAISKNNGIKRANIADLLIPLGVLPGDFVEAMLIQLDQTGKKRGDMVHKSSRVSLRTIRDPFGDEMKDIDNLVTEIGNFDLKLITLGLLTP